MNTSVNTNANNQIRRGEIWYANLNTQGNTRLQGGLRPIVIISNQKCNNMSPVITVVALTSNVSKAMAKKLPTQVFISKDCGLEVDSIALCEQPRSIDKSQLINKVCEIDSDTMEQIEKALMVQLAIDNNQNKIMDYNYLKELLISINQLNQLQKELNKPIKAKNLLLEEFITYCKSFNKDHTVIADQIKNMIMSEKKEIKYAHAM